MEELTFDELIQIGAILQQKIVETKCFIETFGSNECRSKTLRCLESAYEKIDRLQLLKMRGETK